MAWIVRTSLTKGVPTLSPRNEEITTSCLRFIDSVGLRLWLLSPLAYRVKDLTMHRKAVSGHVTRFHPMSLSEEEA